MSDDSSEPWDGKVTTEALRPAMSDESSERDICWACAQPGIYGRHEPGWLLCLT